jgi:hypothetical protein
VRGNVCLRSQVVSRRVHEQRGADGDANRQDDNQKAPRANAFEAWASPQHGMSRMLAPGLRTSRRTFLYGVLTVLAAGGCVRVPESQAVPSAAPSTSQIDAWNAEARAMLQDGLRTLQTFDNFAAFRVSTTDSSGMRSAAELVWDAPTGAAWEDATHVARGLHGRADQLFQAITSTQVDQSVWREQRMLADVVADIRLVGDSLASYRDRVEWLPPGDASGALTLLDRAWAQWQATAGRIGLGRAESMGCTDGT